MAGGGLLCEPLARLGADVTGLDASIKNKEAALIHAKKNNLKINYIHTTLEELDIEIFIATLNKTIFSLIFAKFTAEYILNLLPKGTHDWNKFLTPEDIYAHIIRNNCEVLETVGINFNPLNNSWTSSQSTKANFIVAGKKN